MKITCISDTHTHHNEIKLPGGDVLVHAGDISYRGTTEEVDSFLKWFSEQPYRHKVFIVGNHDWLFEKQADWARTLVRMYEDKGVHYLCDEKLVLEDLRIYGSPWQPWFFNWAFNFPASELSAKRPQPEAEACWARIPNDTDLLITHGPAFGILDQCEDKENDGRVGCPQLRKRLMSSEMNQELLHVCGHIHEANGCRDRIYLMSHTQQVGWSVNAAICNRKEYAPVQPYYEFDWEREYGFRPIRR